MTETTNDPRPTAATTVVTSQRLDQIASGYGTAIRGALFGAVLLLIAFPIYTLIRYGVGGHPPFVWLLLVLGASAFATAVVDVLYARPGQMSPGEKLRILFALFGGLFGITFAVFGLLLPMTVYSDVFGGGFPEWRKHPQVLLFTALPLFGGLALTFVSLLSTSGMQRTSQGARRILYGFNAVVSGVLLLFIFLLLNVLPYSGVWPMNALAQTADWTSSGLYSLSQATKERLASLDKPVKVYVLMSGVDQLSTEVDTLMHNFRENSNRFTWVALSPEVNYKEVEDLTKKYQLTDPRGLLVVYGTEPNTSYEFIPTKDLFEDTSTQETRRFAFKGEAALTKALAYLAEGKTKSVVYFTQGHGELDFNDRSNAKPDVGVGEAATRLGQGNYDVKPLTFDAAKPKVPEDADVVIIARPTMPMEPGVVGALRTFAAGEGKKKGRLFVLMDVVATRDGKMAKTGLEPFLAEHSVQIGDDRLIAVRSRNPLDVVAIPNPEGENPIARAFFPKGSFQAVPFQFNDVRTVSGMPAAPGAPAKFTVETLMLAPRSQYIVAEANLNADPEVIAGQLAENTDKLRERIVTQNPSVAVTVSETKSQAPPVPGHEFMKGESSPSMVVFGDASWISNRVMAGRNGADNYDLFVSCVNWLRERPDVGAQAVADKARAEYRLPPDITGTRLLIMPVTLILLTVIFLGTGVWIVRRR